MRRVVIYSGFMTADTERSPDQVVNSSSAGHLLSALPLRTKQATVDLAATLRELGADLKVIAAAERG